MDLNFSNYLSPFTWRYGSEEMKYIFSEQHKHEIWRDIWIALAEVQHEAGLVSQEELENLKQHKTKINLQRIIAIEKSTHHDVVAAIRHFAEQAKIGGGKIHAGATSMDIVDNTDMLRYKEAIHLIETKLVTVLQLFRKKIDEYADFPCLGFTHLQPAEPTTVGYRLAMYGQDLIMDYDYLQFVKKLMKGKGMKGAVGTRASYTSLLEGASLTADELDKKVMKKLNLDSQIITSQVYSRKIDYLILSALTSIASSLAKFAADLRILQSPPYGEWSEPFGKTQVGSSAMPFKKNPINSEKICSLSRYVTQLPNIALENASHSYLERTLDDSSNKRIIMPEAFLALDEILITASKIVTGLVINKQRITHNLKRYAPFAATEGILMAAVKKGGDRQKLHETLRDIALEAWSEIQQGKDNPMEEELNNNQELQTYITKDELNTLLDVKHHIGDAPERANNISSQIKKLATIDE